MRTLSLAILVVAACRSSLETENAALRAEVERLGRESAELDARLRELETALHATRPRFAETPGPASARVVEAWSEEPEVVISMGSREFVRAGDRFHVMSVGLFDAGFPGSGAPPREGDTSYPK